MSWLLIDMGGKNQRPESWVCLHKHAADFDVRGLTEMGHVAHVVPLAHALAASECIEALDRCEKRLNEINHDTVIDVYNGNYDALRAARAALEKAGEK